MGWTLVSLALVMAPMPSSARSKTLAYNNGNTLLSMCEGQPPFPVGQVRSLLDKGAGDAVTGAVIAGAVRATKSRSISSRIAFH